MSREELLARPSIELVHPDDREATLAARRTITGGAEVAGLVNRYQHKDGVLRGHQVTVVTAARDALALLEAGQEFDVILSDQMMPQMSGMDFHRELTNRYPHLAARVVFISGGAFTTAASAFLERVRNPRIGKPFDPGGVRALVQGFARRG